MPNQTEKQNLQWKLQRSSLRKHTGTTRTLDQLEVGQDILVAGQSIKSWEAGTCIQKLSANSYIEEGNGTTVQRNREVLRPKCDGSSILQRNVEDTVSEMKVQAPESAKTEEAPALTSTHQNKKAAPVGNSDMQQITPCVPMKTTHTKIARENKETMSACISCTKNSLSEVKKQEFRLLKVLFFCWSLHLCSP